MQIIYKPDVFRAAVKVATQDIFGHQDSPTDDGLEVVVDSQGHVALCAARSAIAFLHRPKNEEFYWDTSTQYFVPVTDSLNVLSEKALRFNKDVTMDVLEDQIKFSMWSAPTGLLEVSIVGQSVDFNVSYMFRTLAHGVRDANCSNPYLSLKALKLLSSLPRRRGAEYDGLHFANVPGKIDMFAITPDWMEDVVLFMAGNATQEYGGKPYLVGEPI